MLAVHNHKTRTERAEAIKRNQHDDDDTTQYWRTQCAFGFRGKHEVQMVATLFVRHCSFSNAFAFTGFFFVLLPLLIIIFNIAFCIETNVFFPCAITPSSRSLSTRQCLVCIHSRQPLFYVMVSKRLPNVSLTRTSHTQAKFSLPKSVEEYGKIQHGMKLNNMMI